MNLIVVGIYSSTEPEPKPEPDGLSKVCFTTGRVYV